MTEDIVFTLIAIATLYAFLHWLILGDIYNAINNFRTHGQSRVTNYRDKK